MDEDLENADPQPESLEQAHACKIEDEDHGDKGFESFASGPK